ncbi:MAG TPA: hypothetical protein V6D18_01720, partial [Thermosynechococcaceae cyanobacterium]
MKRDLEKMQAVLQTAIARTAPQAAPNEVIVCLSDRPRQETKAAIKEFFAYLTNSDSAIFVFSGYGFQESNGNLHFVVCPDAEEIPEAMLDDSDNFISASFVQQAMDDSKAQHQVVILDCNFRQTFAEQAEAPEAGVALWEQLGGERRVILTSSIAVQPIGEPEALKSTEESVWSYLHYLAEGIETGAADRDINGKVSASELHNYAKQKLVTAAPANEAQLLDESAEAANFPVLSVPEPEPSSYYRQVLEQHRAEGNEVDEAGEKFLGGRAALKNVQEAFELAPGKAEAIEREVLRPVREFRRRQQIYHQRFAELTQMQLPADDQTRQELEQLQRSLHLTAGDVAAIAAIPQTQHQQKQRERGQDNLARYEQAYLAALQRQNPLNDQDRQILDSLKQVLQLKDEDVEAIRQRLKPEPEPADAAPPEPHSSKFLAGQHARPAATPAQPESNRADRQPEDQSQTVLQVKDSENSSKTSQEETTFPEAQKDEAQKSQNPTQDNLPDKVSETDSRRSQRDTLLGFLRAALIVGLIAGLLSFLYYRNLFPFNLFNKPVDRAAAQKFNEWGQAKAQDGYNERAIEDYSKAIELNPNDTQAYINR